MHFAVFSRRQHWHCCAAESSISIRKYANRSVFNVTPRPRGKLCEQYITAGVENVDIELH